MFHLGHPLSVSKGSSKVDATFNIRWQAGRHCLFTLLWERNWQETQIVDMGNFPETHLDEIVSFHWPEIHAPDLRQFLKNPAWVFRPSYFSL